METQTRPAIDPASNKQIVISAHEAFLAGDRDVLEKSLSPSCVMHQCGFLNPVRGSRAILELASKGSRAATERSREIIAVVAEGDMVALHSRTMAIDSNGMLGPATNRLVQFDSMIFMRIRAGRIAEIWNIQDTASVMSQLNGWPVSA